MLSTSPWIDAKVFYAMSWFRFFYMDEKKCILPSQCIQLHFCTHKNFPLLVLQKMCAAQNIHVAISNQYIIWLQAVFQQDLFEVSAIIIVIKYLLTILWRVSRAVFHQSKMFRVIFNIFIFSLPPRVTMLIPSTYFPIYHLHKRLWVLAFHDFIYYFFSLPPPTQKNYRFVTHLAKKNSLCSRYSE